MINWTAIFLPGDAIWRPLPVEAPGVWIDAEGCYDRSGRLLVVRVGGVDIAASHFVSAMNMLGLPGEELARPLDDDTLAEIEREETEYVAELEAEIREDCRDNR